MITVGDKVEKTVEHSHAPDARSGQIRSIIGKMHELATTSNDPPRRIIKNNTCNVDEISAVELPSNGALARRIRRARNKDKGFMKEPKSLAELVLTEDQLLTLKGDTFVLFDNKDPRKRVIIFTTNANLTLLVHCELWGMDGTFDVTPPLFDQLYTIHG